MRAEYRECVQCLDGDESRRASVELGTGLRQGDERLLGLSNILHTAWLPGWQNAYNTLGSEASVDALRFCGSDRGGPRQAVCIHRAVEPSSCELSLFVSRNWREPVVSEMFPTLSVVLTGLLGLWLTPTIPPVLAARVSLIVISMLLVVQLIRSNPSPSPSPNPNPNPNPIAPALTLVLIPTLALALALALTLAPP